MISNGEKIPPVFVNHGGGPMPLMCDENHKDLVASIKKISQSIPKPKAILVISAHWEESELTLLRNKNPPLLFDYGGFPDETYEYTYPVSLAEEVNLRIEKLFSEKNLSLKYNYSRGLDHGVFVPLMLMYPDANIPVTELSISSSLDPKLHYEIGEILSPLTNEGVLVLASGMSFHNIKAFFNPSKEIHTANMTFTSFLLDTLTSSKYSNSERKRKLVDLKEANKNTFRLCHPREEHLIPLLVIAGAAKGSNATSQQFEALNFLLVNFVFDGVQSYD
jgi:aromatic ring-opening dioxygenase catalytic subunit (LigB family)